MRASCVVQLAVARITIDHVLWMSEEKIFQNQVPLAISQSFGRFDGAFKKRIARLPRRILGDLHHHRWHKIERLTDAWKFLEQPHHAVVIFERVKPRPR